MTTGLRILPVNFFDQSLDVSVSPAAVATRPVTNLQSNIRDKVWRSGDLSPQVITGSWAGNARNVSVWGIWPGTSSAALVGAQVRLQLYSDAAGTVQVYDSGTLDFFTFSGTGWGAFSWGLTPWGSEGSDRTGRLAPFVRYIAGQGSLAFKITISNGGAVDSSYFEARRIWLAEYVEAPYSALIGAAPQWKSNSTQQRTVGGSLRRIQRARWREMRVETVFSDEGDRATWMDLTYLADPALEVVLSVFPGELSRRERDFTAMGSFEVLNPVVFENINMHKLQISILES